MLCLITLKRLYLPPELSIVSTQLFYAFYCFFVIETVEIDCTGQVPALVENVDAIVRHPWPATLIMQSICHPWMMPNAILGYLEKAGVRLSAIDLIDRVSSCPGWLFGCEAFYLWRFDDFGESGRGGAEAVDSCRFFTWRPELTRCCLREFGQTKATVMSPARQARQNSK